MKLTPAFLLSIIGIFMAGAVEAATESPPSAIGSVTQLQRQHEQAEAAYRLAGKDLGESKEAEKKSQELWERFDRQQADLFMKAAELARANPSSDVGFAALEWMLAQVRAYYLPAGPLGLELLSQQYARDPKVGRVIAVIAYYFPAEDEPSHQPALQLLKAVAEANPDRAARGQAALGLARLAKRRYEDVESDTKLDPERLLRAAVDAFDAVIRDYGDCPNLRTVGVRAPAATLGQEAEPELHELRHLRVGKAAPEIEGEDLNGVPFKLTDYRGKVVLLVFWAQWCGPCMADVPHEKELAQRFTGRPFALIGINGDRMKSDATETVSKHQIPWRSFWNGKDGANGPIAADWNVRSWPRTFVLDQHGFIRHKDLRGTALDEPIEMLVQAVEGN